MWNADSICQCSVEQNVAAGGEKHMVTDRHTTTSTHYYSASRGIGADQTNSDWTGLYLAPSIALQDVKRGATYVQEWRAGSPGPGRQARSPPTPPELRHPTAPADQRPSTDRRTTLPRCRGRPRRGPRPRCRPGPPKRCFGRLPGKKLSDRPPSY